MLLQITKLSLSSVPSGNIFCTIWHNINGGAFVIHSTNVEVLPNGDLVTPFFINIAASANDVITVRGKSNCETGFHDETIVVPPDPTTTTTTAAPTTTTTTEAPDLCGMYRITYDYEGEAAPPNPAIVSYYNCNTETTEFLQIYGTSASYDLDCIRTINGQWLTIEYLGPCPTTTTTTAAPTTTTTTAAPTTTTTTSGSTTTTSTAAPTTTTTTSAPTTTTTTAGSTTTTTTAAPTTTTTTSGTTTTTTTAAETTTTTTAAPTTTTTTAGSTTTTTTEAPVCPDVTDITSERIETAP